MARDKNPDLYIKEQIRASIRKTWSRHSHERKEVVAEAKVYSTKHNKDGSVSARPEVRFKCAECKSLVKSDEYNIDHKENVGKTPDFPPDGTGAWDRWIAAVFCKKSNLQLLCISCHAKKTKEERSVGRRDGPGVKTRAIRNSRLVRLALEAIKGVRFEPSSRGREEPDSQGDSKKTRW
jgi:ribosomal protein L44E